MRTKELGKEGGHDDPQGVPENSAENNVATWFVDAAEKHPDAAAVIHSDGIISYHHLATSVLQVSQVLREEIGIEDIVAVEMDRSPELLVSLLGALHAGGVVALIDPALPRARRQRMLDHCSPLVHLTADEVSTMVQPVATSGTPEPAPLHRDNAAYICHTSGSTGDPKGITLSHRSLRNRLRWGQGIYPLGETDRVLWHTAPSFDFSVWEALAPLSFGACVVVSGELGQRDLRRTAGEIVSKHVTAVHFVPSVLRAYLRTSSPDTLAGLRYLFLGGEQLDSGLLRELGDLDKVRIFNQYGPSETCIDSTYFECTAVASADEPVPIGEAISGTQTCIVAHNGTQLAGSADGELGIAGEGIARGYLNDARLTATRFIPSSLGPPGSRVLCDGRYRQRPGQRHTRISRTQR